MNSMYIYMHLSRSMKGGKMVIYKKLMEESLSAFWICKNYHFSLVFLKIKVILCD